MGNERKPQPEAGASDVEEAQDAPAAAGCRYLSEDTCAFAAALPLANEAWAGIERQAAPGVYFDEETIR